MTTSFAQTPPEPAPASAASLAVDLAPAWRPSWRPVWLDLRADLAFRVVAALVPFALAFGARIVWPEVEAWHGALVALCIGMTGMMSMLAMQGVQSLHLHSTLPGATRRARAVFLMQAAWAVVTVSAAMALAGWSMDDTLAAAVFALSTGLIVPLIASMVALQSREQKWLSKVLWPLVGYAAWCGFLFWAVHTMSDRADPRSVGEYGWVLPACASVTVQGAIVWFVLGRRRALPDLLAWAPGASPSASASSLTDSLLVHAPVVTASAASALLLGGVLGMMGAAPADVPPVVTHALTALLALAASLTAVWTMTFIGRDAYGISLRSRARLLRSAFVSLPAAALLQLALMGVAAHATFLLFPWPPDVFGGLTPLAPSAAAVVTPVALGFPFALLVLLVTGRAPFEGFVGRTRHPYASVPRLAMQVAVCTLFLLLPLPLRWPVGVAAWLALPVVVSDTLRTRDLR